MNKMDRKSGIYRNCIKCCVDWIAALIGVLLLSPVFALVALLVRIKLGKPIIFKQERIGLNGKKIMLYKFRSMSDERDENGELLPDEDRLGNFGRVLRSTSLDEIPSLINVLKGELALVGPRPLPTRYWEFYTDEEKKRHDVRPGITGWAQVNGRNYVSWEDKFSMDIFYVENLSMILDLKILLKTVMVVFKHSNIDTGSYIEHDGKIYRPLDVERRERELRTK